MALLSFMHKRRLLACSLFLCLAAPIVSVQAAEAPAPKPAPATLGRDVAAEDRRLTDLRNEWYDRSVQAMWWGDFDALERLYNPGPDDAKNPYLLRDRRESIWSGVSQTLARNDASETYFNQVEALTLEWARQHPKSAFAHLLHAHALSAHGWAFRGGQYAREIPDVAWDEFRRLGRQAADYLLAHKEVVFQDSHAHMLLMQLGRTPLNLSNEQRWNLAQEGLRMDPYDESLYVEMVTGLLPRWGGGTPEQIDAFIRDAVRRSRPQFGTALYARLYSEAAAVEYGDGLLQQTLVKWPEMKAGFDDLLARYPSVRQRNRFAYFACLAKDRPTYRTQMALLEGTSFKDYSGHWGRNAQRTYDECKSWGAQL